MKIASESKLEEPVVLPEVVPDERTPKETQIKVKSVGKCPPQVAIRPTPPSTKSSEIAASPHSNNDVVGVWRARTPKSKSELMEMLKELDFIDNLPEVPRPKPLEHRVKHNIPVRLIRVQKYISSLQYNHTGVNYFGIRKDRGAKRLASTSREIMRECLPIKCVEAVFLGFYLTIGIQELTRIPIRFQSTVPGSKYHFKHIVMAVCYGDKWGAIGLSRKKTLMYKELIYSSLSALLKNFNESYEAIGHKLEHVGIGLPFGHDEHSVQPIHWRPFMIHFRRQPGQQWSEATDKAIDAYISKIDSITATVMCNNRLPSWFLDLYPNVERPRVAEEEDESKQKQKTKTRKTKVGLLVTNDKRKKTNTKNAKTTSKTKETETTPPSKTSEKKESDPAKEPVTSVTEKDEPTSEIETTGKTTSEGEDDVKVVEASTEKHGTSSAVPITQLNTYKECEESKASENENNLCEQQKTAAVLPKEAVQQQLPCSGILDAYEAGMIEETKFEEEEESNALDETKPQFAKETCTRSEKQEPLLPNERTSGPSRKIGLLQAAKQAFARNVKKLSPKLTTVDNVEVELPVLEKQ
mmetsp:Transcript_20843/g.34085  ORF Transcript_20843/g.34085 Transcript_20843/m.34085 type:complete len:581 (+) Transcript_20843:387-2129(+)|eukprot:CAMPEP_0203757598 /NCGR_PEP_ID=MMETSP0098-20131031/10589_1 /ASSEMBLY_ACC=CAM_ASM_000208 /TAXON_ID=96639 /ORGANISM=" , Strain NY0313808BC1" /LENGTH=580 /DNA_ID=CAMNT_0050649823 /DNA_START=373 /DNA_END=2115 /DNA_ORIENTATION=-